jgi:hypothetical protein
MERRIHDPFTVARRLYRPLAHAQQRFSFADLTYAIFVALLEI